MAAGFATSKKSKTYSRYYYYMYHWFHINKSLLLTLNVISIILLFLIHLFVLTVQINPASVAELIIQAITISLITVIALSLIWRGIVCIAIGILGLFLIHAGILLPTYSLGVLGENYPDGKNQISNILDINQPIFVATHGFFFLGITMVGLSMIIAYKPEILYVRNRPKPSDTIWESYPIWYDDYNISNAKLVGRYCEPLVHIKSLMTNEESYLLWRYEYILTDVYRTPHLVKPESYVPKSSEILRDKESGKMIGKARYVGYFI
jgi:hypothetical protein